jgi:Arc/MetJ-type ribon-helix-helix transcriptional regulator
MPSTTVHIPDELLGEIDKVVRKMGITRNRFVIQACKRAVESAAGQWPKGFFEQRRDDKDYRLLRDAVEEMESKILSERKSRRGSPV